MDQEKILVVDDEANVREMVSKIVNLMGHEAAAAVNGKEALQILKDKPFSIVITDVKMPEMKIFQIVKAYFQLKAVDSLWLIRIKSF